MVVDGGNGDGGWLGWGEWESDEEIEVQEMVGDGSIGFKYSRRLW